MSADLALRSIFLLAVSLVSARGAAAVVCDQARPYDCAVQHVRQGDFDKAIEVLHALLATSSQDVKALNLLGIALTGAGRVGEANSAFDSALKLNAQFYPAMKNLAVNQFTAGRLDRAEALFTQVIKFVPNDPVSHVHLGEIAYRRNNCARAVEEYRAVPDNGGVPPEAMLHFGECTLKLKRPSEAEAVFDKLPEQAFQVHFGAGIALAVVGRDAAAARHFGIARGGCVDPKAALYNQVLSLLRAGEYKAAIQAGETASKPDEKSSEFLNLLAEAYRKDGQIELAYNALRSATQVDPARIENYIDLAILCQVHDNYALALEITNVGLEKSPSSDRLYVQRGVLHAMTDRMDLARADFRRAMELAPARALPVAALAACYLHDAEYSSALQLLRSEAPLRKNDPMLWFLLGRALLVGGDAGSEDERQAVVAFERSARLDPAYAPARAELGKALLKRGEVARAVSELETSIKLDPNNRTATNQLLQAYRTTGKVQRVQELSVKLRTMLAADRTTELRMAMQHIVRLDKDQNAAAIAAR